MKRAGLSLCVLALLFVMLAPCAYADDTQTGKLGDSVSYTFFPEKGLVVVSGEGEMWDFAPDGPSVPELEWQQDAESFDFSGQKSPLAGNARIRRVEIGDGITRIGACAFYHCPVTALTLGRDVAEIGRLAFAGNDLSAVQFPVSLKRLEDMCFFTDDLGEACFLGDAPDFGWEDAAVWGPFYNDDPTGELVIYYPADARGWPMEMKMNRRYDTQIPMRFKDIPAEQMYLHRVLDKSKWLEGVGDDRFSPDEHATRAQLVTALYRMRLREADAAPAPFADVGEGLWYSDAVAWAAARGIVNGYPDGTFRPDQPLSTRELAVILYRFSGQTVSDSATAKPGDEVSGYARDAVVWMQEALPHVSVNYGPAEPITRADMAAILLQFSNMGKTKETMS